MRAYVELDESHLEKIMDIGVDVICTDKEGVIIPPLSDQYLRDEISYVLDFEDGDVAGLLKKDEKVSEKLLKNLKMDLISVIRHGDNPTQEDIRESIERNMKKLSKELDQGKGAR